MFLFQFSSLVILGIFVVKFIIAEVDLPACREIWFPGPRAGFSLADVMAVHPLLHFAGSTVTRYLFVHPTTNVDGVNRPEMRLEMFSHLLIHCPNLKQLRDLDRFSAEYVFGPLWTHRCGWNIPVELCAVREGRLGLPGGLPGLTFSGHGLVEHHYEKVTGLTGCACGRIFSRFTSLYGYSDLGGASVLDSTDISERLSILPPGVLYRLRGAVCESVLTLVGSVCFFLEFFCSLVC